MHSGNQSQLIDNLKQTLRMMQDEKYQIEQDKMNELTLSQIAIKNIKEKYLKQCAEQKDLINHLKKRVYQLQTANQKLQKEENKKQKQQIRKFHQIIGQKDVQLQNFRNQMIGYKNKIDNLECEVLSLKSQKEQIQLFLAKGFQQLKIDLKQSTNSIQEIMLQKIVLQSKYQQLQEKLNHTLANLSDLEVNYKRLQERYADIKTQKKGLQQKCIDFQFQIAQLNNKFSLANFHETIFNINNPLFQTQKQKLVLEEIRNITTKIQNIKKDESQLIQIGKLQKLNQQLVNKINSLQSQNFRLQDELNQLKCFNKITDSDQILKQNSISLFQYFNKKKLQIQLFQERLLKIQEKLVEKEEIINFLIKEQNNLKSKEELQKKIQFQLNTLKLSLEEQYENNLSSLKNNYQKYHSQAVKVIQDNLNEAKIQIQKLKNCIESLQSSKKKKQVMLQDIKKSSVQTNNYQKLEKQNIHLKNLLNNQEVISNKLKKRINLYKSDLSNLIIPQTGKYKKTKKALVRCSECVLQFEKNNPQKICQKCQKYFHEVECFEQHQCINANITASLKIGGKSKSQMDYF